MSEVPLKSLYTQWCRVGNTLHTSAFKPCGCVLSHSPPLISHPSSPHQPSLTGLTRLQETTPPYDPTVGLRPYGGLRGRRQFLMSEVPLYKRRLQQEPAPCL